MYIEDEFDTCLQSESNKCYRSIHEVDSIYKETKKALR